MWVTGRELPKHVHFLRYANWFSCGKNSLQHPQPLWPKYLSGSCVFNKIPGKSRVVRLFKTRNCNSDLSLYPSHHPPGFLPGMLGPYPSRAATNILEDRNLRATLNDCRFSVQLYVDAHAGMASVSGKRLCPARLLVFPRHFYV